MPLVTTPLPAFSPLSHYACLAVAEQQEGRARSLVSCARPVALRLGVRFVCPETKKAGEEDEPAGQKVGWAGGCRRLDNARGEGHVRVGRHPPLGRPPTCSALLLLVWSTRRDGHSSLPGPPARPHAVSRSVRTVRATDRSRGDRDGGDEPTTTRRPWRKAECPRNPVAPHETWAAYVRERDRKQVTLVCCGACVSGGRRHMSWSPRGRAVMIGSWEDAGRKSTAGWWPDRPGLVVLARLPLQLRRLKLSWMR